MNAYLIFFKIEQIFSTSVADKSGKIGKHSTCFAIISATGKFSGRAESKPL
jgi:hypothetical protein